MMLRFFLACALLVGGCKAEASNSLPKAVGSGVQPPTVPKVSELMAETSGGVNRSGAGLTATGTLFPIEQAELGPKATGVLTAVLVEEGQPVKKGQVVFRLDPIHAGLAIQQAKTLRDAASVNLRAAELDYQRTKELHQRGSVPQATFDQVQTRYDSAKNAVAQADVALSMAQRASADTVVRSPIEGVVTAKLKSVGETVTMMPPTIVLIVQNVSVLELRTRIPERNLGSLAAGTKLVVSFPALEIERTVDVGRVNPAVDTLTRTVEIVAKLENSDGRLRPGMLAEVRLATETAPAASGRALPAPPRSGSVRNVATRKIP